MKHEEDIILKFKNTLVALWSWDNVTLGNKLAPTQSLLKKWLIEDHSLYPHIWPTFQYKTKPSWFYLIQDLKNGAAIMTQTGEPYKTDEEALEEALKQALKQIS